MAKPAEGGVATDQSVLDQMNDVLGFFGEKEPEVVLDGKPPRDDKKPATPVEEPKQTDGGDNGKTVRTDGRSGKQIRLDAKAAMERLPVVESELETVRRELDELKGQKYEERIGQLTAREAELAKKVAERDKWYASNHRARLDPEQDQRMKDARSYLEDRLGSDKLRLRTDVAEGERPQRINVTAIRTSNPGAKTAQDEAIGMFATAFVKNDQELAHAAVVQFMRTLKLDPTNTDKYDAVEEALLDIAPRVKTMAQVQQEYQKDGSRIAKEKYEGRLGQFRKEFAAPLMDPKDAKAKLSADPTDVESIVASLVPALPEDVREKAQAIANADAEALSMLDIENLYTPPLDSDNQNEIEAHAAKVQRSQVRLSTMLKRNRVAIWAEAMLPSLLQLLQQQKARIDKMSKQGGVTARTEISDGAKEMTKDELQSAMAQVSDSFDTGR